LTYELLDSTTLASAASSVTFTSIDQSYGDLVVVVNCETSANESFHWEVNNDADYNTNYFTVWMRGGNNNVASSTSSNLLGFLGSSMSNAILQFMDYSATDKHKSVLLRSNTTDNYVYALAGRYADNAAITTIKVLNKAGSTTFSAGSTFSLYGIAK